MFVFYSMGRNGEYSVSDFKSDLEGMLARNLRDLEIIKRDYDHDDFNHFMHCCDVVNARIGLIEHILTMVEDISYE